MNSFGTTTAQYPIYDPRSVLINRARFRREAMPLVEQANRFESRSGREASSGLILLTRDTLNRISIYSTQLQLRISRAGQTDNVPAINNLCIVRARCVSRGIASDPAAIYLVEIADRRAIVSNQWFKFPTLSAYNIRATAYPNGTFLQGSMNGGTTWTWSTMLQNLWEQMTTFLGSWPGLPTTPVGTPEGFWMTGVSAWDTLCNILDHLGMTVVCNHYTGAFRVILKGGDDAVSEAARIRYAPALEDDLEWIDVGSGRVPKYVKVYFRRRNEYYGSEETVRYDSLQWSMTPAHTVTTTTGYDSAAGTHFIWSDFTIRYDQDGQPVSADVATANVIAAERATRYLLTIDPSRAVTRVYAGALPFKIASDIDRVCWYQDVTIDDGWGGWRTRVVREPDSVFEGMQ